MDPSPFLSAVQSLKGATPGQKYKYLHSLAKKTMKFQGPKQKEKYLKSGDTNLVPRALVPHLLILVGLKLKSNDVIVKALQSDDVTIIKLALGAKWFFNESNKHMNVDYFSKEVFPFISLRTRLELIKTLGKCLQGQLAESFHDECLQQYGYDQALPLLVACGESYIYNKVLIRKILLSERMLKQLYRKYPDMIIRYLLLLSTNEQKNPFPYRQSDINFLPNLLKNHPQVFVDFIRKIANCHRGIQLGNTRAEYFLRSATDELVKSPDIFLPILPLKLVKSKLTQQQYDAMLRNLLPFDVNKLYTSTIVDTIKKYYPKEGGFEMYSKHYKDKYGKELLDHKDLFEEDSIYDILPEDIAAEQSRQFVCGFTSVDKSRYWRKVYQLPPSEAIPLLQEQIVKSTFLSREESLKMMLQSCHLYNSKEDLLEVLEYYNKRHKNEQNQVLLQWLENLSRYFDNMQSLEQEHWHVIKDIVQRAYVKNDFRVDNHYFSPQYFFTPVLRYFVKQCTSGKADESDKLFLDKIVNIILEYYFEFNKKWDFIVQDTPEIEEACLDKFLAVVPQKYPENHVVWKKSKNKMSIVSYLIETMGKLNEKNLRAPPDSKVKVTKMLIQYYPWLSIFATELFLNKEDTSKSHALLKKLLCAYFPEFYQNLIDEHSDLIYDVTTNDALMVLRRNPGKISAKIDAYVNECRIKLSKSEKFTKHFIRSLKWYHDIPIKFLNKCLKEIEIKGSILVLGVLMEGRALAPIIIPYLPKQRSLDVNSETAKNEYELLSSIPIALNYANPPPLLPLLMPLCEGDYLSLGLQTLSSIVQRVPIDSIMDFTARFRYGGVSMKKAGIRLVFQISTKPNACEYLTKMCQYESNASIRRVLAKMVFEVFTQTPNKDSWKLMKSFIHNLLPDDREIYEILKDIKLIHADYCNNYLLEIFHKIGAFDDMELEPQERKDLILKFFSDIDNPEIFNKLPTYVTTEIVKEYLFDFSLEFIFNLYLFSDDESFEDRLKVLMQIISENLKIMAIPDLEQPRTYTTMKKLHNKFGTNKLFICLNLNDKKELVKRFVEAVLEQPFIHHDSEFYINMNISQIFFNTTDARTFGETCSKNLDDFVKFYNNPLIIQTYAQCFVAIVSKTHYIHNYFDIIEGLVSYKLDYGVFIGTKLLPQWKISEFDERYDKFVQIAKTSDDRMVQATLYNFFRGINF